jgi:hypothetical protein
MLLHTEEDGPKGGTNGPIRGGVQSDFSTALFHSKLICFSTAHSSLRGNGACAKLCLEIYFFLAAAPKR